jgi:NAD(P)H dehydrogenase (quinone)
MPPLHDNHAMNILIIHAHQEPQSFNTAMKDMALAELRSQGHTVEVSDLYDMNWNPVASAADFGSRANPDYLVYALEQRDNFKHGTLAPDIQAELDKLLRADLMIFNFPIYWFSMPAIMKGWIDRVLISGVCYGGMRFYDRGGLAGKRAMLAVTIGGQAHMLVEGGVHGDLNDMLRHILRGTLAYTGMTVLPPFVAHHVPYIGHDERAALLEQYRLRLRSIETLQGMQFVSMSQFDDRLHPLRAHQTKMVYDGDHADKAPQAHAHQPQGTHP